MPAPFKDLSHRGQLAILRSIAQAALAQYGLEGSAMRLVYHGFNCTYRIESSRGTFALRINVNSRRTEAELRAEVAWITALADQEGFVVARPVAAQSGEPIIWLTHPSMDRPLAAILYTWIPGRPFPDNPSAKDVEMLGGVMAALHDHALGFTLPEGAMRKTCPDVMDGSPWRLPDEPPFTQVLDMGNAAFKRAAIGPARITHFDLHFSNVKKLDGRLAVFDFDDSNLAWPVVDAAQTVFYLRRANRREALEQAFFRGLGWSPPSAADFEALVAGRQLLLASDLMSNETASLVELAPRYLAISRHRLQLYLDTGWFDSKASLPA